MAALHEALKALSPIDWSDTPVDDLKPFLTNAFAAAQTIVDSVPIPSPDVSPTPPAETRSRAASSASQMSMSSARSAPPSQDVAALQKEWKSYPMKPADNPLGMNVYNMKGRDKRGAWFARRSVHEGLGFSKWKYGLEREFPETMKVSGPPGEGNIRGIGGERRIAYHEVRGVGKVEVFLLSAQFPGPTAPRDFVTMLITSDSALEGEDVPRHFMVISKPCIHPEAPPRDGMVRGQYESVEFIREVPVQKGLTKSASVTNLGTTEDSSLGKEAVIRNARNSTLGTDPLQAEGRRARGHTISFDKSRGSEARGEKMDVPREAAGGEQNPIEWIMVTRSDPGGGLPRFLIERGTPGGIVGDASKFLDWACATDIEEQDSNDLAREDESEQKSLKHEHNHEKDLHNYQTNGHLAGIQEDATPAKEPANPTEHPIVNGNGVYTMVAGVAIAASDFVAHHTPAIMSEHLPHTAEATQRRSSISTISSVSSSGSFASALSKRVATHDDASLDASGLTTHDKELQKLGEKKRKLDEKLSLAREREKSKRSEETAKEEEAVRKATEKHEREVKKQEEKYRREVEKLEQKKAKEAQKAEEKRRKLAEKDEKVRLMRELEEIKAEVGVLRKEKEILRGQVGDLQAENTVLAAKIGKLGPNGEEILKSVRDEVVKGGRLRASSSLARVGSYGPARSVGSSPMKEKDKENSPSIMSKESGGSSQ